MLRRFDFESKLQRMSVLVRSNQDNSYRVHLKGSPEKVQELCIPETLPSDFQEILDGYTIQGYRVIAIATKVLSKEQTDLKTLKSEPREYFEKDLAFLGILVMENKLK